MMAEKWSIDMMCRKATENCEIKPSRRGSKIKVLLKSDSSINETIDVSQ